MIKYLYTYQFLAQMKQSDALDKKQIILSNLLKNTTINQIQRYLIDTQWINRIQKFSILNGGKVKLIFKQQADAEQFISSFNFKEKLANRLFNIYYGIFDNCKDLSRIRKYQIRKITEVPLRDIYQILQKIDNHRIVLSFENTKLKQIASVEFLETQGHADRFKYYKKVLEDISIVLKQVEQEYQFEQFVCSIEIINFCQIDQIQADEQKLNFYKNILRDEIAKISKQEPIKIQLTLFLHSQNQVPTIKGYFRFKDIDETLNVFEILRQKSISSKVSVKLYYYKYQANSYYTLFTQGLRKQQSMSLKQFQNYTLSIFRKINNQITQVIIKNTFINLYTAKLYFKNQSAGKDFIADYPSKRSVIYFLYEDKSRISFNIFQKHEHIKEIKKIEEKAQTIIKTFKKEPTSIPHYPQRFKDEREDYVYKKMDNNRNYQRREYKFNQPNYEKGYKYKQKNNAFKYEEKKNQYKQKQANQKQTSKQPPSFSAQDFPNL